MPRNRQKIWTRARAVPSWECEALMGERLEIEIPPQLTEPLLQYASETELSVEDIVETALKNYLERSQDNA